MIKLYGFFKNGDFTIKSFKEVKEEECYLDHILRKKILKGENIFFKYFEDKNKMYNWLENSSFNVANII